VVPIDTQASLLTYLWTRLTTDSNLQTAMGGTVRCLARVMPDVEFPYLSHRIAIAATEFFPMRQATYYLDIWSDSENADELLAIRALIIGLLDELDFTTDEAKAARLWLQTDGMIPEVEQDIWHYAIQFNLRYYRKGEVATILAR